MGASPPASTVARPKPPLPRPQARDVPCRLWPRRSVRSAGRPENEQSEGPRRSTPERSESPSIPWGSGPSWRRGTPPRTTPCAVAARAPRLGCRCHRSAGMGGRRETASTACTTWHARGRTSIARRPSLRRGAAPRRGQSGPPHAASRSARPPRCLPPAPCSRSPPRRGGLAWARLTPPPRGGISRPRGCSPGAPTAGESVLTGWPLPRSGAG
jgi:hypothetical protein